MKPSFHWFLISSTLACLLNTWLVADDPQLSPTNSYNGTLTSDAFVIKSTSDTQGTTYSLTGNVSFLYPGKTTPLTDSCFKQTGGDLTFIGNNYALQFGFVNAGAHASVASTSTTNKALTFSGFSSLTFDLSPSVGVTTGQGTLSSTGAMVIKNTGNVIVSGNFSTEDGGAIKADSFTLKETVTRAIFTNNTSSKKGGAIATTNGATISSNLGSVRFTSNSAPTSGGAINCEANSTLFDNKNLFFENNTALGTSGMGGAISCTKSGATPVLSLHHNEKITFMNNRASSGGAIYANKLTFASGGPTEFLQNHASGATPKGGAISIASSGELSLSADRGDIIFSKNTTTKTNSTATRNAIHIGSNGKITQLRASTGHKIAFYDPITTEGTSSDVLILNQPEKSPTTYHGTLLFSGANLTTEEQTEANLKSSFTQPIRLAGGKLLLQDGVILEAKSFSQDESSLLGVDAGTTLQTTSGNITLNGLGINVHSLHIKKPVKLVAKGSGSQVTLSGQLSLIDPLGNFYENHTLSQDQIFSLLEITVDASVDTNVITTDLTPTPEKIPSKEYGYQGTWTLGWTEDTAKNTKEASITWTKTGFIPNPERKAALVSNTLWGTFIDARSFFQLMEISAEGMEHRQGFWVSGLSNFFYRDDTKDKQGFRHISAGYALGGSAHTPKDDLFTFAFCQLLTRDKDYLVTKNHAKTYAGAFFFKHTLTLTPRDYFKLGRSKLPAAATDTLPKEIPLALDIQCFFSHSDNSMKTLYTTFPTPMVRGSWGNECVAGEIGTSLPITISHPMPLFEEFTPLLKVQMVYVNQNKFSESTVEGRSFDSGKLLNLSIPVGIKFAKQNVGDKNSYDLSILYAPDVYRYNPRSRVSLVFSGDSWTIHGTNLARQAVVIRAANNHIFNPYCELFGHYALELRTSSRNYNVDLGGKLRF
ncbi:polymorphic outer membrane protein middle domain-containing protein [Candidatus Chlamydia sanziniae]|uniref:Polymorphic outer membrane protein G family n=1 Tax=Candidatus Chlamydia sanziniae TaxID=1806891 RepID=A0A1A9HTD5_9CHLA|nr:polymorphic outer membrane protein middle domain-containing protein [Candidatus Chlamydia sanziniae]ANH78249.1 polymorphic outer membrane protein G family [Candidatus Chlamydia sanziniae]